MNIQERELLFKNEVAAFTEYPDQLRQIFFDYWSEPNQKKTKMKWEMEKTWDTKKRLNRFLINQNKWNGTKGTITRNTDFGDM